MKFGYIREYSGSKSREDQYAALKNESCKIIKEETASEPKHSPVLIEIIDDLHSGDTLVVENVLVLSKTAKELLTVFERFYRNNIDFKSCTEPNFDTTTDIGKIYLQAYFDLKQIDSQIIKERTKTAQKKSRARGVIGGRRKGSYDIKKASAAARLYSDGWPIAKIMETTGIKSKDTLYKHLRRMKVIE